MKKQFTFLTLSLLLAAGKLAAQFAPIATTGYGLDAVAETTTAANTTGAAIDGSSYVLYSANYGSLVGSTYGLANSGLISTATRTFQLQPYNGPNLLYVPYVPTATLSADTINLVNPAPFLSLSLLGFSTEGSSNMVVKVRFTDGTSQSFTGLSMGDWFQTGTTVISGFDRVNRNTGTPDFNATNPKLFANDLAISCANQGKFVSRVIVQNNGNGASSPPRICAMALSGISPAYGVNASTLITCGATNNVTLTSFGMTSYTWQPVGAFAGSNGTNVVVSPTATTTYTINGTVASGCPGSTMVTIYGSLGNPTLSLAGTSSTVCLGSSATILAGGAITYTLSNSVANGATFTPAGTAVYTVSGTNGCGTSSVTTSITVTPLPVTAVTLNSLVCSGLTTTLTAGGAASYSWSPGPSTSTNYIVNPTANTIYTLTGFNPGNCHGSTTLAVATKPNPIMSISANTPSLCAGSSVQLTITGDAVTYTWSTGQNGTSITDSPAQTTLYSASGTSTGNCVSGASLPILVYVNPSISASASNPLVCSTGSSTLAASGASTYVWTGMGVNTDTIVVNPVTDATYSVTGTSSVGCVGSTVVTVNVFAPVITVSSGTAICKGGITSIGADAADSWMWSNGATFQNITVSPTLTTVYSVTASVNNLNGLSCDATNTVQVTVYATPTITAVSNHTAICLGNSAVLTADGAGANGTYTWTGGSGAVISSSTSVSPITTQIYTLTGTDANGCKGKGVITLVVSPCTGIATNEANAANLLIYPNPTNGSFSMAYAQDITLHIINELGQLVSAVTLDSSNNHQATIENLPVGIYFVKAIDGSASFTQKIIITR